VNLGTTNEGLELALGPVGETLPSQLQLLLLLILVQRLGVVNVLLLSGTLGLELLGRQLGVLAEGDDGVGLLLYSERGTSAMQLNRRGEDAP